MCIESVTGSMAYLGSRKGGGQRGRPKGEAKGGGQRGDQRGRPKGEAKGGGQRGGQRGRPKGTKPSHPLVCHVSM